LKKKAHLHNRKRILPSERVEDFQRYGFEYMRLASSPQKEYLVKVVPPDGPAYAKLERILATTEAEAKRIARERHTSALSIEILEVFTLA